MKVSDQLLRFFFDFERFDLQGYSPSDVSIRSSLVLVGVDSEAGSRAIDGVFVALLIRCRDDRRTLLVNSSLIGVESRNGIVHDLHVGHVVPDILEKGRRRVVSERTSFRRNEKSEGTRERRKESLNLRRGSVKSKSR